MSFIKSVKFWITVVVSLYAIAGFIVLPKVALKEVQKYTQENFDQKILIQNITFNPFTLNLALHNVQIQDKKTKENLISADEIGVNIELFSLATDTINLDNIELIHPKINAVLAKDGQLNLALIQPRQTDKKEPKADEKPMKLPFFSIDTFTLENATIDFTDNTLKEPFSTHISEFSYVFHDLSTQPNSLASHELSLNIDKHTTLKIDGGLYLDPLLIYGNVDLTNFQTNLPIAYLQEKLNFHVPNTLVDVKLGFIADLKQLSNPQVTLKDAFVGFEELQIQDKATKSTQLKLDAFRLNEMQFDLQNQKVLIDSIHLDRFYANALINKDKSINIAQLFQSNTAKVKTEVKEVKKSKSQETTVEKIEESKPWELLVEAIVLKNSTVDFTDNSLAKSFKTQLSNINFSLEELTLKQNDTFKYDLSLNLLDNATFKNNGTLSLFPLGIQSHYVLSDVVIPKLNSYIQPNINFNINSATVGAKGDFELLSDNNIKITKGVINLSNLKLSPKRSTQNLITLKSLQTSGLNLDLNAQKISIANVTLDQLFSNVKMQKNKKVNLETMFAAPKKAKRVQKSSVKKATKTKPWKLNIKQTKLKNSSVLYTDYSLAKRFKTRISQIYTTINDISLAKNNKSTFTTSLRINKRAKINLNGNLILDPLVVQSKYKISSLSLPMLQPYIDETLNINLKKALLYTNGSFTFKQRNSYFSLYSNVSLNNLSVDHKLSKKNLLEVKKIKVDAINLKKDKLTIKAIKITQPNITANIYKNQSTNFSEIVKENKNKKTNIKTKKTSKKAKPFSYDIGPIAASGGKIHFSDETLPFDFKTDIHDLEAKVSGLSTDLSKPTKIDAKGQIDQYGLADINATLNTSDPMLNTQVNVYFKNISMQNYTPYSGKFIGQRLANGALNLDLNYNIKESQLEASNSIILEKLELGEAVESKDAVSLPLGLAIALLEDSNGVIDIDLPITGDINNPDFAFGPIIWGAFGRLIVNIVTSPFKLLGSILGVSPQEISKVIFEPGLSTITPPAKGSLDKVLKALNKRPNLSLVLQPSYTQDIDLYALQLQKLDAHLIKELEKDIIDKDEVQDELEDLYKESIDKKELKEIEKSFIKVIKDKKTNKSKESFDQDAYIAKIKDDLVKIQKLDAAALETLAKKRTDMISTYLIDQKKLEASRISVKPEVIKADIKDKKWAYYKLDISVGEKK
ncbi:MAG: DUF748 domain-containing protein [Campylobacterota bacterium]|nr:DUF748 domain-containing protein [Campylobacterota bacterium]